MEIRKAVYPDAGLLSRIISRANIPVARQFGLTRDNAPSHPSLCIPEWVSTAMGRGERYFLLEMSGQAAGCVAYESPGPDLAYLNRLAVLPEYQGRGLGRKLVDHIIGLAEKDDKQRISIGIIKAHEDLKHWYLSLGFKASGVKKFDHLPFDVQFMVYTLGQGRSEK